MTFAEWVQDYYEVVEGNGPVIYCDDWTEEPVKIWRSYVVFPQELCGLCNQPKSQCYPACTETYGEDYA